MQTWISRSRAFLTIAGLCLAGSLWAAPEGATEITEGAKELKETLAAMPYSPQGEGPIIYSFEFSECPHSQRFYKDWKGRLNAVQMRRFFYAVSQKSANETAALAASQNPRDYQAYMEGRKTAPRFDDTRQTQQQINQNFESYQAVMKPLVDVVTPILVKNGAVERNLTSPMLIWEKGDRVFAAGGYDHAHIESVLAHVKADAPSTGSPTNAGTTNAESETREASPPTAGEQNFDIKGFTTGMSKEEFLSRADSIAHEDFGIGDVVMVLSTPHGEELPQTAHTISVDLRDKDRNPIKGWTTRNPMEERVFLLTYSDSWTNEEMHSAPGFENYVDMLKAKYGDPVHSSERRLSATQWTADYVFSKGGFRDVCPHEVPISGETARRSNIAYSEIDHFETCPTVLNVHFSYLKLPGTPVRAVSFSMFDPQLWKKDVETFNKYWDAWMNDYLEKMGRNREKPSF